MTVIDYKDYKQNFNVIEKLGKGNCASVFKIQHIKTLQYYALKYSRFDSADKLASAIQQIEVVRAIDHPTAIQIFYSFVKSNSLTSHKGEFGIIMELAQRSLEQDMLLRRRKQQFYTLSQLQQLTIILIQFFAHVQSKGYMHRDIKPANILIMPQLKKRPQISSSVNRKYQMNPQGQTNGQKTQDQRTKILKNNKYRVCDFGFGTKWHEFSSKNIAGTACYASPKIHTKFKNTQTCIEGNNFRDDVYSLGVTLIQLASLQSAELTPPKRLLFNINNKYGLRFSQLLTSMTEFQQIRRPDFIKLKQNYKNYMGTSNKIINNPSINTINNLNLKLNQIETMASTLLTRPQMKTQNKIKAPQIRHQFLTQRKIKQQKQQSINSQQQQVQRQKQFKRLFPKGKYLFETADSQSCVNVQPLPKKPTIDQIRSNKPSQKNKKFVIDQYQAMDKQIKNKKLQKQFKNKLKQQKNLKQNLIQYQIDKKQRGHTINPDKIKTKRRSKLIIQPNPHYKLQYLHKSRGIADKDKQKDAYPGSKFTKGNQIYMNIDDQVQVQVQAQVQNNSKTEIKNYLQFESTIQSDRKHIRNFYKQVQILIKTNIKNIKPQLISYLLTSSNKKQYIFQEGTQYQYYNQLSCILCVGHQNYLYLYYQVTDTQPLQYLCIIFPQKQKLLLIQYNLPINKLAIISQNNIIRAISLETLRKQIQNSIDKNIKSLQIEAIKPITNIFTQTNSMNTFSFSNYLQSVTKIKNDGSVWENSKYLTTIHANNINYIKYMEKVDDYVYVGSCEGQLFRYRLTYGEYNPKKQQINKQNMVGYYNCHNTIIAFQVIKSNISTNTKIVGVSATGFVYILNQNLKLISMKNISKNCLVACNISLKIGQLSQEYTIYAVDYYGSIINQHGQLIAYTDIQQCSSIIADKNQGIILITSQSGIIYKIKIKQSNQIAYIQPSQAEIQSNIQQKRKKNNYRNVWPKNYSNYRMYQSLPM